jgi:hypothetical protein
MEDPGFDTRPQTRLEQELDRALHTMLDRNDQLEAELKQVKDRLDGLLAALEKGGSLGLLQAIGADKSLPIEIRVRALGLAVPFERPKLSMSASVQRVSLYNVLEGPRPARTIEAKPALASDLEPDPAA